MDGRYASHRLRTGRWSSPGYTYLVTTVTKRRSRVFEDFAAARTLIEIIREDEQRGSHSTLAFVVMPDHLHWLLLLRQDSLARLVGRVKSLSSRRLGSSIWQPGFHDHCIRDEDELMQSARYIVANPLRAGLVEKLGCYPHWDAIWL